MNPQLARLVVSLCLLAVSPSFLASPLTADSAPCVTTRTVLEGGFAPFPLTLSGQVCGQVDHQGQASAHEYLGIEYAHAERFGVPTLIAPVGQIDATQPGAICPQKSLLGVEGHESCLYLNVWTPASPPGAEPWPVMVYVHGGAFIEGSSTAHKGLVSGKDLLYDGTHLAAEGVVVVSFNYRLGPLGFLAMKDGTATLTGNYGLLDQLAALEWVQQYVSAFGGDPAEVTIFGESAGAISVGLLALSSSRGEGTFHQAMMESNPLALATQSPAEAQTVGETFLTKVGVSSAGCKTVECLETADFKDLVKAGFEVFEADVLAFNQSSESASLLPWAPVLDGTLLTEQPLAAAKAKAGRGELTLPMLFGTNEGEGWFFQNLIETIQNPWGSSKISKTYYDNFLRSLFGKVPSFPSGSGYECTGDDCSSQLADVITDYAFTCANQFLARMPQARYPQSSVYTYRFDHLPSFGYPKCADSLVGACPCKTQVCHGAELPFVFDTADGACEHCSFTTTEQALSKAMVGYWVSFASSGVPTGTVSWPQFGSAGNTLLLDVGSALQPSTQVGIEAHCSFWDGLGYEGGVKP